MSLSKKYKLLFELYNIKELQSMIKINEKLIRRNYSDRKGESIKYIVIHDTANTWLL